MAFVKKDQEEELMQEDLTTPAPAPQLQPTSSETAPKPTAPKGSGQFPNLTKFIEANRGKAEEFTKGFTGSLRNPAISLKQDITNIADETTSRAASAKNIAPTTFNLTSQEDPNYVLWQRVLSGTYGGPETFTGDVAKKEAEFGEIGKKIEGTQTTPGLTSSLSDFYKQKGLGLSRGEERFNASLMKGDKASQDELAYLRQQGKEFKETIDTNKQAATKAIEAARQFNLEEAAKAKTGLEGRYGAVKSEAEKTLQAEIAKRNSAIGSVKSDITEETSYADAFRSAKAKEGLDSIDRAYGLPEGTTTNYINLKNKLINQGLGAIANTIAPPVDMDTYNQILAERDLVHANVSGYKPPSRQEFLNESAMPTLGSVVTPEQVAEMNALAALTGLGTITKSSMPGSVYDKVGYEAALKSAQGKVGDWNSLLGGIRSDFATKHAQEKEAQKLKNEAAAKKKAEEKAKQEKPGQVSSGQSSYTSRSTAGSGKGTVARYESGTGKKIYESTSTPTPEQRAATQAENKYFKTEESKKKDDSTSRPSWD